MSDRDDRRDDRRYEEALRPARHRGIVVPRLPWLEDEPDDADEATTADDEGETP